MTNSYKLNFLLRSYNPSEGRLQPTPNEIAYGTMRHVAVAVTVRAHALGCIVVEVVDNLATKNICREKNSVAFDWEEGRGILDLGIFGAI